ncbi:GNAT family N-acetyltransferase [Thermoflavimicrobium daqui]|jgi:RimJ/RimL family protein N-acetyltransferase|uniref:N-acetyltransferase n=1 Tax=Thermoflavimicrobium daqui TaxID=2137476 RepID=A0A364K0N3_9BACL|nr:GNAT family protein [Thermoflavimicrobium daqui]RAL21062.1 N-acetyltransferase [Thermoflavimicrobium daqui]
MTIHFHVVKDEIDELIEFLTSENWPFHGIEAPSPTQIREAFMNHYYTGDSVKTIWLQYHEQNIGLIRLFDLLDSIALFDLRIRHNYRGKGFGKQALQWLTHYAFTHYPHLIRIEAHTRVDNFAMRKTLYNCGYIKEGYHRQAWEQGDQLFDSIVYAMIRSDWENQTRTPIRLHDVDF